MIIISENNLTFILESFEMKNTDLAERLDCSKQLITEWIKGRKPIPNKRIPQLSEIFDIPEDYFVKELSEDEKREINEIAILSKYDKSINELEEKRMHPHQSFGSDDMTQIILNLFGKVLVEEKDTQSQYRKMLILKNLLYLMLDDDHEILFEVIDLLSQDIEEFEVDLIKLVDKYIDYL